MVWEKCIVQGQRFIMECRAGVPKSRKKPPTNQGCGKGKVDDAAVKILCITMAS